MFTDENGNIIHTDPPVEATPDLAPVETPSGPEAV
jgi:hypothetical protein